MPIFLYISILFCSATQSATTKFAGKAKTDPTLFNAIKAASAFLVFFLLSLVSFSVHLPTIGYAVAYGIALTISMMTGYKALTNGPLALTSMLVSFSILIPMAYGFLFQSTVPKATHILGFVLLFAAILLVGLSKKEGKKKATLRWLLYVLLTFLTNGICSVLQAMHQESFRSFYLKEFMVFAMLIPTLFFLASSLIKHKKFRKARRKHLGMLSGLANGAANYATLALAGYESAALLFPAISAGTILMSLFCGFLFFKEKPRPTHFAAIALGIASVVLLKL